MGRLDRMGLPSVALPVGCIFLLVGGPGPVAGADKSRERGPAIAILCQYPGMPVKVMKRDIMSRFQRWTAVAKGLDHQEARALQGVCIVKDYFRKDVSLDDALSQVTGYALSDLFYLPPGTIPPRIVPFDPQANVPVGLIVLSRRHPAKTPEEAEQWEQNLHDLAHRELRRRLQSIPGVVAPTVQGGARQERLLVSLDPKKLATHKITATEVRKALLEHKGDPKDRPPRGRVEALRDLVLVRRPDATIRVRDVAEVRLSLIPTGAVGHLDGQRVVCVPVWHAANASREEVDKRIHKARKAIKAQLESMKPKDKPSRARGVEAMRQSDLKWHALGTALGKDGGLLTLFVRAPVGTTRDAFAKRIAAIRQALQKHIPAAERRLIYAEMGINPDLSLLYSRHAGPEDATIRVQLVDGPRHQPSEYAGRLRRVLNKTFPDLQLSFHPGFSTDPAVVVRITGRSPEQGHALAQKVRARVVRIPGAVDVHIAERMTPTMDRESDKESELSLPASFWMEPTNGNHYFLGVQTPHALEDLPAVTDADRKKGTRPHLGHSPIQISHVNNTRAFHVRINVEGRKTARVAREIEKNLTKLEVPRGMKIEVLRP